MIDPNEFKLVIQGMVDRPLVLTMDEIKRLPSVSRICFLECNGNGSGIFENDAKTAQDTHGRTSTAEWTGVSFSLLLREAFSRFFTEYYLIPVGIIFIAMIIFMPQGLLGFMRRWLNR